MLYIFDGTKSGFLTAFVKAFQDENAVVTSKQTQLLLGQEPISVVSDEKISAKAAERLLSFDRHALEDLDILLRCGMADNEQIAFRYFRLMAELKRPVGRRLAEPDVFTAIAYIKKVSLEIHHFHGFVRFMETESGALYAPIEPDNDICDLLVPHFKARLPEYPFIIHDVKRQKAAVYDGKNTFNAYLPQANVLLCASEEEWQSLWKNYYHAVNIPSRERLKQMKGYMPVRYWKYMPEKQETPDDHSQ